MALKDWKKFGKQHRFGPFTEQFNQWLHNKTKDILVLAKVDSPDGDNYWAIGRFTEFYEPMLEKRFKTRQEALKFARDYMKKNKSKKNLKKMV